MAELVAKTAEEMAKEHREVSVSEFFERNRHLLGYDNPTKALATVVKELVDNSLDACESARILPRIWVEVKPNSAEKFNVMVKDNGPGIVDKQIPYTMGKLLYGSKFFKLAQSRGQQGIGASGAVLYSQLTTGKPTTIISSTGNGKTSYYELMIDVKKNEPQVLNHKLIEDGKDWHGLKIEMDIEGRFIENKQSVVEYVKQIAIANPYAEITFEGPNGKNEFPRGANTLPPMPKEIKPHPHGIELGILRRMLESTNSRTVLSFMTNDFSRVGRNSGEEICKLAGIDPNISPKRLTVEDSDKLFKAMHKVQLMRPPTDCLSPLGEELLLKGLQKEIKAEFFASTTRPPAVYRGNPFVIECCSGDTILTLENGDLITIKEYVENNIKQNVLGMKKDFKIVPNRVLGVQKFKNERKILKITTRSGRKLKVTDNNELPILQNGELLWKEAKDVTNGEFIAVPRRIMTKSVIPNMIDLFNHKHIVVMDANLVYEIYRKLVLLYGSAKRVADLLSVKYDYFKAMNRRKYITRPSLELFKKMIVLAHENVPFYIKRIERIAYRDTKFTNPKPLKLSDISEDLLYLLGLLNADGYIGKYGISFINRDETLHKLFKDKMMLLFREKAKKHAFSSYVHSKTISILFNNLRKILLKLPNNLIVAWLKGFVDGDGWISLREGELKEIGIATAKEEEANFVQTVLLRLDILSKIEYQKLPTNFGFIKGRKVQTKKPKYNIIIRDFQNASKFSSLIGFRHKERAKKLNIMMNNYVNTLSKTDIVPIASLLSRVRKENNLFQYQLGLSDVSIRQTEKQNQLMTRSHLRNIASLSLVGNTFNQLCFLAFSDILWDKIVDISVVPHEDYVYDLTTECGNFVANNIIMHNCGIAYGGELPQDQTGELLRFANRVPLLYQAGDCAITKSVMTTDWKRYGLQQPGKGLPTGPIVVMVHMASVWVPFVSESKQAVASYPDIIKEIKLGLQEVGRKLQLHVSGKRKAEMQQKRREIFERYIPEVAGALGRLTDTKPEPILTKLQDMIMKKRVKEIEGSEEKA